MSNVSPNPKPFAVHVAKGTALRIPVGGLSISFGQNGALEMKTTVEVLQVMTPHWLGIAVSHLDLAKQHHESLVEAISTKSATGLALEGEFLASMQAAVAAAVAFDALYASVKEHVALPPDMVRAWQKNRTARYAQVAEVLSRGFKLKSHDSKNLRQAIKMVFETRDVAIHPPGEFSPPELHPDLGHHMEWRFVRFRYEIAREMVRASLRFTIILASKKTENLPEGLVTLAQGIITNLDSQIKTWNERHGKLFEEG